MKAFILAILMACSLPSFAEPMAIDVPIVIFTQEEFAQLVTEVKKLYAENEQLKAAVFKAGQSCKKA